MKTVYVCGDSFGVPDPDHGPCWVDLLIPECNLVNLSTVAASNLMISLQIDRAIQAESDYIIYLATSCTRSEVVVSSDQPLLEKLIPYSILNLDRTLKTLDVEQLDLIKRYHSEFFDLSLAIYTNQCIIENNLHKLSASGIPFSFDQGGFEHHSYGGTGEYFSAYNRYRSSINLWDHAPNRLSRPYYHVTDFSIHQMAAEYYAHAIAQA
jgi:hypothetical protein